MLNLKLDSPFRPPDWRWQKAQLLYQQGRALSRKHDDGYIAKAKAFLTAFEHCADEWELLDLTDRYPDLYLARELYARPSTEQRAELEARILTGDPLEAIATQIGFPAGAVSWYEKLFFHVTDRLHNVSYILHQVLGKGVHEQSYPPEVVWKLFGFVGGRAVLESVLLPLRTGLSGGLGRQAHPEGPEAVRSFFGEQLQAVLTNRSLIALLQLRCRDDHLRLRLLDLARGFREIEAATPTGPGAPGTMTAAIGQVIRDLGWAVGSAPRGRPGLLAIEPRALDPLQLPAPFPREGAEADVGAGPPCYPEPALPQNASTSTSPSNGPSNGNGRG